MKHSDFQVGCEFRIGENAPANWPEPAIYRCTDIGRRTIAAIRVSPVEISQSMSDGGRQKRFVSKDEAEKMGLFNGPPYGVLESIVDEYDQEVCHLVRPAPTTPRGEGEELKMWLAIRTDIDMPPGKLAVQAGHAFGWLHDFLADPALPAAWREAYAEYTKGPAAKIAVRVDGEEALIRANEDAKNANIPTHIVLDAGRTVFKEPTYTVCAFGPSRRKDLPSFLRRLRLYGGEAG